MTTTSSSTQPLLRITNIRRRFEDYTEAEYNKIFQTNLHGVAYLTQKVGARMIARGQGGRIIHIASLFSTNGVPYVAIYGMTKSAIAGLTRKIMKDHNIDADRVFIAGLSAGGAAAAIMAETYPDIYCAAGVHSGIACGAASDMTSAFAVMSGRGKARGAMADAKARAFVPMIVFHGDKDTTVHPSNGADVIARAGEQARLQRDIENASTAGRSYTRALYRDKKGRTLMEDWVIHGAGHAWSGGSASGSFTDPKGPDASREMLRFFLNQRR